MAEEHLFTAEAGVPVERKSGWRTCLTGCLVALVILAVLTVLIGVWVSRNWRDWVANGIAEVVRQEISKSPLPAQEQQEIMVQIRRVTKALRDGTMSMQQLGVLAEKLTNSPLMPLIVASTIEQHYVAKSGLSEQEKTEGRTTLQRFIRGAIDKKIKEAGIDAAMAHVADRDARGRWKLRPTLTDDDLRAFFAEAKQQADAAGIPEQPADVDPSEEIKQIVDEALAAPT